MLGKIQKYFGMLQDCYNGEILLLAMDNNMRKELCIRTVETMKVGAAVVSARRGGCSATFDMLNKYFTISGMPVASSQYWNSVHGNTPDEVRRDEEGMQVMRTLGRNTAFLIKSIALGKEAMPLPEAEPRVRTNFIR